jgi:hypothetical protein
MKKQNEDEKEEVYENKIFDISAMKVCASRASGTTVTTCITTTCGSQVTTIRTNVLSLRRLLSQKNHLT